MKDRMSEEHLARIVIEWLRSFQWEIYQEVPVGHGVADIVAMNGPLQWVIETKTGMSMQLLKQLDDRMGTANLVSGAIPRTYRAEAPTGLLQKMGVGLLLVRGERVEERLRPQFLRRAPKITLNEEQKTFAAAGSPGGGHWTPFKETARNVLQCVSYRPGCTMKELIARIKHHYSSPSAADANILRWIDAGVIKGVRVDRSTRPLKLYPNGDRQQ
jgi:hypothetical protein